MFKISGYGRTVNLRNPQCITELERYKKEIGERVIFPLGDDQYKEFEIWFSRIYRAEFLKYVNLFGGLEMAAVTLNTGNIQSNLIEYWCNIKKEKEKTKKRGHQN